jgi:hypothetical protein
MRNAAAIALGLLLLGACAEPEPRIRCRCTLPENGRTGCTKPWPDYNKGIRWHTDLREAFQLAHQEGKLVFYFLLVGDLDKSHC